VGRRRRWGGPHPCHTPCSVVRPRSGPLWHGLGLDARLVPGHGRRCASPHPDAHGHPPPRGRRSNSPAVQEAARLADAYASSWPLRLVWDTSAEPSMSWAGTGTTRPCGRSRRARLTSRGSLSSSSVRSRSASIRPCRLPVRTPQRGTALCGDDLRTAHHVRRDGEGIRP